jgi:hypothetical protein
MGLPDLPHDSACNGKLDVLFVIGQGGVSEHLEVLQASYASFAATMAETFVDHDLHVMVVEGDGAWGDDVRCPKDKCPPDGSCLDYEGKSDFPCWALHEPGVLTACDNKLGAGVVFPAGWMASNKPCAVPGGRRYLRGDDASFAELFTCVARVGATPGEQLVGWAAGEALSFDLQDGCNAGFLRDDALLIVVMIAGAEDSPYNPYVWAQRVLEAKGEDHDKIVALAIARDSNAVDDPVCEVWDDSYPPHSAYVWHEQFEHSVFGSDCAPSFAPFFEEAASVAAELCEPGSPE